MGLSLGGRLGVGRGFGLRLAGTDGDLCRPQDRIVHRIARSVEFGDGSLGGVSLRPEDHFVPGWIDLGSRFGRYRCHPLGVEHSVELLGRHPKAIPEALDVVAFLKRPIKIVPNIKETLDELFGGLLADALLFALLALLLVLEVGLLAFEAVLKILNLIFKRGDLFLGLLELAFVLLNLILLSRKLTVVFLEDP